MKKSPSPESGKQPSTSIAGGMENFSCFEDACIQDMNYFVKTIAGIKAKGIRPDLIGSIIAHYASKWLPDLSGNLSTVTTPEDSKIPNEPLQITHPESVTTSLMKKRFFVETLIGILPPEKESVPCNFLLRLLRMANMVGANSNYLVELEARISWQLDQASLKELMIPSFNHTCQTLLDVELVKRLVKKFAGLDTEGVKTGASLVKVAKLVDSYLAEAAVDGGLNLQDFISLIEALPNHARTTEDGLYRAIDTYLKAHPELEKQERKELCRLIDSRKLSPEAALHAAQNDRLPVRSIIRVLFTEQTKLGRHIDWSSSFSGARSPNPSGSHYFEPGPARCMSKREMNVQQAEIRRLREDVAMLQSECGAMHKQLERLVEKKSSGNNGGGKGFFRWKRLGLLPSIRGSVSVEKMKGDDNGEREGFEFDPRTPGNMKTKLVKGRTPQRRRNSMS